MTNVPDGTINEVMDWVGDDPEKAAVAYEAETAGKGRTRLLSQLEEMMDAATAEPEQQDEPADDEPAEGEPVEEEPVVVSAEAATVTKVPNGNPPTVTLDSYDEVPPHEDHPTDPDKAIVTAKTYLKVYPPRTKTPSVILRYNIGQVIPRPRKSSE